MVTDQLDDLVVVDAAVRLAAARNAPVLLVAVLSARRQPADRTRADAQTDRAPLARVLPRLRSAGVGYIPVVHHVPAPADGRTRPRAADGVLALAVRHHSPLVVASARGPAGLDAHSLIRASALCGGPSVHAVTPGSPDGARRGCQHVPADSSPAVMRTVGTSAGRRPPAVSALRLRPRNSMSHE
ncbi:hypothetical protein BU52_07125 [Streptomyces toyocaensis]|uniref:UspA domain-containing protein n=1 Tax=Streptomyces toyocaensis TaxID=55952 RepID=A0A081XVW8_STRTO|nr:hypothetical protein BU52_07125 [Streptomyces toyocaensis]